MIIAIIWLRKAAGHQAAQFHESTVLEIVWTIVPVIILVAMAIPAAKVLVRMTNTSDPDMSIKIDGYQWKWQYDYLQDGFSYFSMLAADSNAASQLDSGINPDTVPNYLRDVDHPMVVPTGKKIRLLITSNDVIHSWWMYRTSPASRCHPRLRQRGLDQGRQAGNLSRRLHRTLRPLARLHAHRGGGEELGRLSDMGGGHEGQQWHLYRPGDTATRQRAVRWCMRQRCSTSMHPVPPSCSPPHRCCPQWRQRLNRSLQRLPNPNQPPSRQTPLRKP